MAVHDLPAGARLAFLRTAGQDATAGGRIYDAHIAEVARAAGAKVVVTDTGVTSWLRSDTVSAWKRPPSFLLDSSPIAADAYERR